MILKDVTELVSLDGATNAFKPGLDEGTDLYFSMGSSEGSKYGIFGG